MASWERGAVVLAPLAAVATMALGLRLGAAGSVRAAVVYGAPPSADRAGLAWQLVTLVDDRGVREAVPSPGLTLVARAAGREARWAGATNADGVAEVWLDLPGVTPGTDVTLDVRAAGERAPLAEGHVTWPREASREEASTPSFARPSKQDGELRIDVAVYAGRLVPGASSSVWVRVTDRASGAAEAGVTIDADAEPGLSLDAVRVTTDASGWARVRARPTIHVVALGLRATEGDAPGGRAGAWYGALPVAPGAASVDLPEAIAAGQATSFDVLVSTVTPRIYAEIDDASGRAAASVVDVVPSPLGPHARVTSRPLSEGTYWLVTADDPRGAESSGGGALARPFLVTGARAAPQDRALGPRLSTLSPPSFARFVALDGLPGKRRGDGGRRARGLALAFGSLVLAAAIETLLVLRGVGRARRDIARVADLLDENPTAIERRWSAANVVLGVLLGLLGFALLAAMLVWKAG